MKLPAALRRLPLSRLLIMWLPRFRVLLLRNSPRHLIRLTTQMKSVGEVMAIGRTFQESLQKALRGMEMESAALSHAGCGSQ